MSILRLADRVKETTTTTGTGALSLAGADPGFQGIVAGIGDGNSGYFFMTDGVDWESFLGVITDGAPDTLSRTVIKSSNGNALVNWGAGTKDVWLSMPATHVGEVLLAMATASSSATIDFSVDDSYYEYRAEFINLRPATNDTSLLMRVSIAAAVKSDATYAFNMVTNQNGTEATSTGTTGTSMPISDAAGNAAPKGITGNVTLFEPGETAYSKHVHSDVGSVSSSGSQNHRRGVSYYGGSTAALDGIRFLMASGNIASGVILLWGRKRK